MTVKNYVLLKYCGPIAASSLRAMIGIGVLKKGQHQVPQVPQKRYGLRDCCLRLNRLNFSKVGGAARCKQCALAPGHPIRVGQASRCGQIPRRVKIVSS